MLKPVSAPTRARRRLRTAALRVVEGMADEGPLLCGCEEGDCLFCASGGRL